MLRFPTNQTFQVAPLVEHFKQQHPGETILGFGATKAIETTGDMPIEYNQTWETSLGGVLIVTDKALHCLGSSRIEHIKAANNLPTTSQESIGIEVGSVIHAAVVDVGRGVVLKVETADGKHYQFGLMKDVDWFTILPFSVEQRTEKIKYSAYSVRSRINLLIIVSIIVVLIGISLYLQR